MKILVAIDLSDSTKPIINQAEYLAKKFDSKLFVMHVSDSIPEFLGMEHGPQSPIDTLRRHQKEDKEELEKLVFELIEEGIEAQAVWTTGPAIDSIIEKSLELDVNMIVLGSHGHGAMYQILVGSVSEGVLHRSKVPVLVVPTHNR